MAGLRALELALHQPQRLPRGEDGLSRLVSVSEVCCRIHSLDSCWDSRETYPAAGHCELAGCCVRCEGRNKVAAYEARDVQKIRRRSVDLVVAITKAGSKRDDALRTQLATGKLR
jgi:hypothetical protein